MPSSRLLRSALVRLWLSLGQRSFVGPGISHLHLPPPAPLVLKFKFEVVRDESGHSALKLKLPDATPATITWAGNRSPPGGAGPAASCGSHPGPHCPLLRCPKAQQDFPGTTCLGLTVESRPHTAHRGPARCPCPLRPHTTEHTAAPRLSDCPQSLPHSTMSQKGDFPSVGLQLPAVTSTEELLLPEDRGLSGRPEGHRPSKQR